MEFYEIQDDLLLVNNDKIEDLQKQIRKAKYDMQQELYKLCSTEYQEHFNKMLNKKLSLGYVKGDYFYPNTEGYEITHNSIISLLSTICEEIDESSYMVLYYYVKDDIDIRVYMDSSYNIYIPKEEL